MAGQFPYHIPVSGDLYGIYVLVWGLDISLHISLLLYRYSFSQVRPLSPPGRHPELT